MRYGSATVLAVVVVSLVAAAGCENTVPSEAERAAVESAVRSYLEALAETYSDLDASHLEGHATSGEIAAVRKLLRGLAASGDRVESTLIALELESVEIFREVNATVTLFEVWDVRRYDAFNGREKGRNPDAVQNTIIQLRLMDGTWLVTARRNLGDTARSRWKVTTPTPAPPAPEPT